MLNEKERAPVKRAILGILLMSCSAWKSFSQGPEDRPKFDIADVHISPKRTNQFPQTSIQGDRYEVKNATIVDLIRMGYSFDPDKILGGPIWLEMDHFDILAKMPKDTPPEDRRVMLQSLLENRFSLQVHKESKPLLTYALRTGKKPQLKESDGSGETGCKMQSGGPPVEGGIRLFTGNANGQTQTINLGPGMVVTYQCRNMTMKSFVQNLRGMGGNQLGANPVLDETGLEGAWNFDLKFSLSLMGPIADQSGDRISIVDAVEKQLGLKLEQKQVPTPVIVVDSVNNKPSPNPPGIEEAFPTVATPTEFEVASVKPVDTATSTGMPMPIRMQTQPGGRVNYQGVPLSLLVSRALNTNSNDQIVGLPQWASTERYDVIAKAPSAGPNGPPLDNDALASMFRALLTDRFKLKYHTEERPVNTYTLVAAKPKLKKADPANRTSCKNGDTPPGSPPATRVYVCRNITMQEFADKLQNMSRELSWPVLDGTELEGRYDLTVTYSQLAGMPMAPRAGGDAGAAAGGGMVGATAAAASDPNGGYTIFEAFEKELGLKLELQKRPAQVFVIDHIEQKPTEN
jgi:uncharacterized protein (TIGR03435 family)